VLLERGLPGLGIVIVVADFQMAGMSALEMERLNRWVRKLMPEGPRCWRWRMVRLSGPAAVEEPDCLMVSETDAGVKGGKEWSKGWRFRI